ncbi:CLUMA_CG015699, isoform A [Clunio marinus]|uniref:CLUMA_CG015699, isoform A n=1 Tax=Clunio marinus TaxID=568069 RepID=A0A1J1IQD5_9DIPT|nr:CLUMA_CG015699, isoform A [Clunio marinus]
MNNVVCKTQRTVKGYVDIVCIDGSNEQWMAIENDFHCIYSQSVALIFINGTLLSNLSKWSYHE